MSARYYQGKSVTGPVQACEFRTFSDVVERFRICAKLAISHADFLALDEKQRNEKKQVPFFVPACFKEATSKRVYGEATHCNLIFLDIDPEKEQQAGKWVETGRYPAAPFVHNPDSLYVALAGFNFAAHLTASSTPEKPRMRIVVDADKIPLTSYPSAAVAVAALLGLPSVTKESKVAVQPMFLPVLFSDTVEEDHPLIAYSLNGRAFTVHDIGDETFGDEPQKTKGHSHKLNGHALNGHSQDGTVDALEFLRAQVPEITLGIARDALFLMDADCSRADWLNAAAALKHQFTPHKEDAAYELFDEWSQKGTKYVGQKETAALWKSLRPSPIGRVPVTIRTLLHHASLSGWNDNRIKESLFAAMVRWFEEVDNISDLMDKGPKKILATPLITSMQEDVLIAHLCAQAKKRFAYSISVTSVRKDMTRLKNEIKSCEEPPEKTKEPPWAKNVFYVSGREEFYRHHTSERFKTLGFNSTYGRHLLPTKEQLEKAGLQVTPAALATPIVQPSVYALNHLKIPTVYEYAYDPGQPTDVFFVMGGRKYVNIYTPTYPTLDLKRKPQAQALFQNHLEKLIAEPEHRRTLTDFMAFLVQFPGRKIRWAPLLQSVEGAGKSYLEEVMRAVLGVEHVMVINGDAIKSGWNEWAFGKQLIVLDEVRVVGTSKHEIMNTLKPLITNDEISVNERFCNNRQVQNITNYIIFSNHHDALALSPGDRRYFVLKSPLQTKAQVRALGDDYFPPLFAMVRDHPGALRAFLADWTISPEFNADGPAPRTKYAEEMVSDSANDLTSAVRRILIDGDCPLVQYDIVSAKSLRDILMEQEGMTKVTAQQVAQALREEGFQQVGRHQFGDDRHYLWARAGVDAHSAVAIAAEREKKGLKNLCMEVLF